MSAARRLARALATVAGVLMLGAALQELAPGDALTDLSGHTHLSQAERDRLRHRYGLDRPAALRWGAWLQGALRGDPGFSIAYQRPVGDLVWPRWRRTAAVGGLAFLLAWGTALPLAAAAALRRAAPWRLGLNALNRIFLALPALALAPLVLAAMLVAGGDGFGLIGPVVVLALVEGARALPALEQSIQTGLERPFVLAARARGRGMAGVLLGHVLRAELPALLSLAALAVAHLLTGSVIVEATFGYPGLGSLALEAVVARDPHLLITTFGVVAATVVGANLAADSAAAALAHAGSVS